MVQDGQSQGLKNPRAGRNQWLNAERIGAFSTGF